MARGTHRLHVLVVPLVALLGCLSTAAVAAVRLPSILGDHMVLQRGKRVALWGWASPGQRVTVGVERARVSGVADGRGEWLVRLGPLEAGGPYEVTIATDDDKRVLRDVLVGDVWVASGQSNMEWPLAASRDAEREVAASGHPRLRLFNVTKAVAQAPQADCQGSWAVCGPLTSGGFSAVGYFFARELQRRLGVPIGVVETAWGGTPAESWAAHRWLTGDADLAGMLARIPSGDKKWDSWTPTGLFNAMIAPIARLATKGCIWYQGESNAGRAYQYRKLFPTMIRCWRSAFGDEQLPFFWVQLANFTPALPDPAESDWAELREAQSMTLSLPMTGQAVTIDIGEAADIHPRNKQDVGARLALAALRVAYGQRDVEPCGPTYKAHRVRGSTVVVQFDHVDGGLAAADGKAVSGFSIAGDDRKFRWADARVEGNSIVVSASGLTRPVAVRYAWANNPVCNLANRLGLPASPFRTDDWPGTTVDKR